MTFYCSPPVDTRDEGYVARLLRDVDALLAGRVRLKGFPPVDLGPKIDWSADPFAHPSWRASLHNLQWVRRLFMAADATGSQRYRDHALAVIRDWVANNPRQRPPSDFSWQDRTTGLRAEVLAWASRYVADGGWLRDALQAHGRFLADPSEYAGGWNHGLDQDLGLLAVAHALGEQRFVDVAERRIHAMYPAAIDAEGVSHEQAIGYQQYNYVRFSDACEALRQCGRPAPAELERRLALMPSFLAHATMPNGNYAQIGDMFRLRARPIEGTEAEFAATMGATGPKPDARVRVYQSGYVFGRSGWGEQRPLKQESFYALRFGPPRAFHGHHDHMSVLYYSGGLELLVDSGFDGYDPTPYLGHVRNPSAHNVVVATVVRRGQGRNVATRLINSDVGEDRQVFTLADEPYDGVTRQRRATFSQVPEFILVEDSVRSPKRRSFSQLWHLPPGTEVAVAGDRAVATVGGRRVEIIQHRPVDRITVVSGAQDPLLGWVSRAQGERLAAPVVVSERRGKLVEFETLIRMEQ